MTPLLFEIALRLLKAAAALVIGVLVYLVAVGVMGAEPSVELALLSWLAGGVFILLVETSPI
ncbi:MAG TPA: hypothetical protein VLA23_11165 [Candidatus Limnocylindrales bacterium]|nr:hypothetical protein [Candidatus Limnocylindrales bacterium]